MIDLPITSHVRNGPRFAEGVDTVAEHVVGTIELPELKARSKRPARPVVELGPIVAGPAITEIGFASTDPRGRLVAWAIEREAIRVRKEAGQAPPWTAEPILAAGYFCNVRREDDRTTRWIAANIIEPHRDDPDLWFALVIARCCSNEPEALAELLPLLSPFDAAAFRAKVEALLASSKKVYRTNAYKPVMPPRELKGITLPDFHADHILGPMWREREALRPQPGESLDAYSAHLEACYRIGPFLAAQVVADLKHVAPLKDAADWWTFARPGPGSERGLNRARSQPVKASWSDATWHRELLTLQAEVAPLLAAADLAPLDAQNLQNVLCEFDRWERARDAGGKPSRRYQSAPPEAKPPKAKSKRAAKAVPAERTSSESAPPAEADEIPAFIRADFDARAAAKPSQPTNGSSDTRADQKQWRHSSAGESPHGSSGAPRGRALATYIYDHPDLPPPHHYLLVEKRIDAAGNRNFFQYRWADRRLHFGVKGSYAERKVPYQLSALKAALAANPDVEVQITEGEKDCDTLRRLGFVATTNPGGAAHWTDDLTAWLRTLGTRRVVLHEDNDAAGRKRSEKLTAALSSFVTVRVARYADVPDGEDVTYWIETLGHTKENLAARIAAAEPAGANDFTDTPLTADEWLARVLPEPDLLLGHFVSTTARIILNAPTGIGKTNLAMAVSGHIGAGKNFLHWHCPRPRQILYVDGEMSRQLLRERIADLVRRLGGPPIGTHFFSKEDVPNFAPLNTREGQAAVWALIDEVERRSGQKLDAIVLDSIMALLLGDMKEEDAWRDTMPMVLALTERRIGQIWVHHTGHDTSHGYGTKTREWQLDTVLLLEQLDETPPDLVAFRLLFKKARTRTPANRLDFADASITLSNDQWSGVLLSNARGKINESLTLKFYEALCAAAEHSTRTGSFPTASIEEWRAQCTAWGLLDPSKAHSARTLFARHKLKLIAANWVACSEELAWVLP